MITTDQLVAHLVGDYLLQSDWMANRKRASSVAAGVHALVYTLCFLPISGFPSGGALSVILATHFLIDRFGLARYVVWAKNFLAPRWMAFDALFASGVMDEIPRTLPIVRNPPWWACSATGYPPERPAWLSVWLLIIADNVLHILINGAALKWL